MTKSTVSFTSTAKGYTVRQGGRVIFRSKARKEARQILRQARAAERAAVAYLKTPLAV